MSEYVYNPRFTFLARCWWQASDTPIEPTGWAGASRYLSALWVETGSRGARGHVDRYLRGEPDGWLEKTLSPTDYQAPAHEYYELFWFGAYQQADGAEDKPLSYEVRVADRVWNVSKWVLDYNSSFLSGYVGIWEGTTPRGVKHKPAGARLWTLEGVQRGAMQEGSRHYNLQLLTPENERIRRYKRDGAWFFNSRKGEPGFLTMEILSFPLDLGEP
ncbi:hypothetical protein ACQKPE_23790 [Pseudomonas sp. NPDC089554]|uniref:hypothetical protein n=1 Tax=Pseudomonas sp. NPDC089554 TaxID=3390653 RepID=UPI003CFED783